MTNPEEDLYEILQVSPNAHHRVIEAAYRRLAQMHHPDIDSSPGSTARMIKINLAYKTLSDSSARAEYDANRVSATPSGDSGTVNGATANQRADHTNTSRDAGTRNSSSLQCPRCHRPTRPGASFCGNCGLPFTVRPQGRARAEPSREAAGEDLIAANAYRTRWTRVSASVVDAFVFLFVLGVLLSIPVFAAEPSGIAALAVALLFPAVMLSQKSSTFGKMSFRMNVVKTDGAKLSFIRAWLRELIKAVSVLLLGAPFLVIFFREDRRGIHDVLMGTMVIRRS